MLMAIGAWVIVSLIGFLLLFVAPRLARLVIWVPFWALLVLGALMFLPAAAATHLLRRS